MTWILEVRVLYPKTEDQKVAVWGFWLLALGVLSLEGYRMLLKEFWLLLVRSVEVEKWEKVILKTSNLLAPRPQHEDSKHCLDGWPYIYISQEREPSLWKSWGHLERWENWWKLLLLYSTFYRSLVTGKLCYSVRQTTLSSKRSSSYHSVLRCGD